MMFVFELLTALCTLAMATLILFIVLKLFSTSSTSKQENTLDSKRRGRTILITGPVSSGKTLLFQKLSNAPKLLQTVHSLKENASQLGQWKLVDLPLDTKKLHSQPANFFHFNDLAALVLCLNQLNEDLELVVIMSFAVGILKRVPLCIAHGTISTLDKDDIITKLVDTLNNIQNTRLTSLLSTDSSTISFDDPINRLIFESEEGEVAADYQSQLRSYFDEHVTINSKDEVHNWIGSSFT